VLRLGLGGLGRRRLGAVGLDHHQAGAFQQRLGIDSRFLAPGFLAPGFLASGFFSPGFFDPGFFDPRRNRWRQRFLSVRFQLPAARQGFAALILAQLIFLHQEGRRGACRARFSLGRPLLAAALAVPVASPVAAAATALLVLAFARRLTLA